MVMRSALQKERKAWARRARLAGIVVAASALVVLTAVLQACWGGAASSPAGLTGHEPPVTIVIQPPPAGSTSAESLRLDLSAELPSAPPPKPGTRPPRRGNADDPGDAYE